MVTINGSYNLISDIPNWEDQFDKKVAEALNNYQFTTISSKTHQALRLEGIARLTISASLFSAPTDKLIVVRNLLKEMADDLQQIHEKCNIIGYLLLPSTMEMAITDLSIPTCVICSPVVDTYYLSELDKLNLKHFKGLLT